MAKGEIDGIMTLGNELLIQVIARKKNRESEKEIQTPGRLTPQFVWTRRPTG